MNREAATLGTPVYSIFRGEMGGVDRALIGSGRMVDLGGCDDSGRAEFRWRPAAARAPVGNPALLPM